MAGTELWNASWLTQNTQRTYPFAYDASLTDATATYRIPNSLLVAATITVRSVDWLDVSLLQVLVGGTELVLFFSRNMRVTVPRNTPSFASLPVENAYGFVTIGDLSDIQDWPLGLYTFPPENTRFDVDVARPPLDGISTLRIQSNGALSPPLVGDVVLTAGNNLSFSFVGSGNSVRLDAAPLPDLTQECGCDGGGVIANPKPIYSVNGVRPDSAGNIQLTADGCFEFGVQDGRLIFRNKCAEPCCDCKELDSVMSNVQKFVAGAANLSQLVSRMEIALETLRTTALSVVLPTDCVDSGTPGV